MSDKLSARDFFETLFGDATGFLFLGWRDDDGELNQQKFVRYPESLNTIENIVKAHRAEDLYFSPMLYTAPRRRSGSVSCTPVVYADTDLFDPAGFLVAPTLNVQSSEGHTHSYWVLDKNSYKPEDVSRVARAIAHAHTEKDDKGRDIGVDPSGWALTKLLRVPGTTNQKIESSKSDEEESPVFVRDFSGEIYSLSDLTDAYDPEKVAAVRAPVSTTFPTEIPDPLPILQRLSNIPKLYSLYSKVPDHNQDWSDTLYLFVSEMLREGFAPPEVLSVGWNAACNKYNHRDNRPMEDFWEYDIARAIEDPSNIARTKLDKEAPDDPKVGSGTIRPTGEGVAKEIEELTLTKEEIDGLQRTFVDDYVKWALSKTDAPAPYHVASALSILSLILGEWAVAYPKYGDQRLGLFFTVLGETTDSRKTTSRNLMKKLLRLTEVGDFDYILTSDATEEALIDELSERAHQSSLYERDEVQKLIEDIKGGKGYMKGFLETLNELYDGNARGRLRSSKRTKDTSVNFVQYLMGIRSQFQENLELSDFKSGWGPRNIFVRGESPPRTRENSRLQQGSDTGSQADHGLQKLAKKLVDARNFWSKKMGGNREAPFRMLFEDEAWIRQTDWEWDLKEHFADHPKFEYLKPSLERMSINVMKVAILFAMMNEREVVAMDDVLNAHHLACQWVEDLVIIVEGVSESYEMRYQRAIEEFVLSKGGLCQTAHVQHWAMSTKGMKRRDFWDSVESLQEMNVLEIVDDNKGRKCFSIVEG